MSHLLDHELSAAERDLSAWLLEDDVYQTGFCDGAKETHSLSADESFKASDLLLPGYLENLPVEGVLKNDWDFLLPEASLEDEDKNLAEILERQSKEELKQLEISNLRVKQEENFAREIGLLEVQKQKQLEDVDQSMKFPESPVFDIRNNDFTLHEVPANIFEDSSNVLPTSSNSSSPAHQDGGSWQFQDELSNTPYIITVPLSEVSSLSVPSQTIQAYYTEEPEQQVVINIDPQSSTIPEVPSPQGSTITLKEALDSENADDFLNTLLFSKASEHSGEDESSIKEEDEDELFHYEVKEESSPVSEHGSYYKAPKKKGIRGNPYAVTERKLRKKEQNKKAALKYRLKKKDEESAIATQIEALELRNQKLLEKFEETKTELRMMKELARTMLVARGALRI